MRKIICLIAFAVFLLAGCNVTTSKKESKEKAARETAEIEKDDSISRQIDSVKTDIESSTKQVDSLLNGL